jgi:hypothetical protein
MEGQVALYEQLFNMRMKEKEKVAAYAARLMDTESKLKQHYKEHVSDRMLVFVLLRGLPKSYTSLVQMLRMLDSASFMQVLERLKDEEERQLAALGHGASHSEKSGGASMSAPAAAVAYAASTEERTKTCFTCKKNGHSMYDCPDNKNKDKCDVCRKVGHTEATCWHKQKGRRVVASEKRGGSGDNGEDLQALFIDPL